MQNNSNEVEVFRITPMHDRLYETATYTRKTGEWTSEKYFTTHTPRFVGKFVKHCQIGYGDGAIHYDIFEKDGHKVRVDYSYDGTTCYREYDPLSQTGAFVLNPEISSSIPDPNLFDLQHNSGPKPTCCLIT